MADSKMHVLYMAHPVAGDVEANLQRALRWLKWCSRTYSSFAVIAPWIANIMSGEDDSDPAQRAKGLAKCSEVASRCDGIILVGGRVSTGMALERDAAIARGGVVLDHTSLGDEPPQSEASK